jgi:hypothetical protein
MTAAFVDASDLFVGAGGTASTPGSISFSGTNIPSQTGMKGNYAFIVWGNAEDDPVLYDTETWLFLGDVKGGDGTWGADDTGPRHISAYYTPDNIAGTTQTFTNGGANSTGNMIVGIIVSASGSLTYLASDVAEAFDNVEGSGYSATFNHQPAIDSNDLILFCTVANNSTLASYPLTLAWPGLTVTPANILTLASGHGHNSRINMRRASVTGTPSGIPTISSTTDMSGCTFMVVISETNTSPTPPPVAVAGGDHAADPWLEFPLDGSLSDYSPGATFLWEDITVGGTGDVTIANPTALNTTANVSPTVWGDEDYVFRLTVTDAGGTDTDSKIVTVLRSSEFVYLDGADRPLRIMWE